MNFHERTRQVFFFSSPAKKVLSLSLFASHWWISEIFSSNHRIGVRGFWIDRFSCFERKGRRKWPDTFFSRTSNHWMARLDSSRPSSLFCVAVRESLLPNFCHPRAFTKSVFFLLGRKHFKLPPL